MKIYRICRYIDSCVGRDTDYERRVHKICYSKKCVSILEMLICEEYLEVNAFRNNKCQAYFLFKNTFYANFL